MVKVPNLFLDREAGIVFENTVPFFYHLYTMNPCVSNAEFFGQNRPTVKQILASVFIILNYKFFASVCDSETFFFFYFRFQSEPNCYAHKRQSSNERLR